ncbi:MAG: hypothetical protein F4X80_06340 [Chloroflexi bacterium]|nr:hypothetical protein [Chloroflexota bacterium]
MATRSAARPRLAGLLAIEAREQRLQRSLALDRRPKFAVQRAGETSPGIGGGEGDLGTPGRGEHRVEAARVGSHDFGWQTGAEQCLRDGVEAARVEEGEAVSGEQRRGEPPGRVGAARVQ